MTPCAAAANMTAAGGTAAIDNMEPTVEEVMTPHPTMLQADMNVRDAVHVLLEQDISGAPVVDASGKLVGVLSESDLIWKGAGVPQDHYLLPPVFLGFADAFIAIRDNPKIEEEVHKILARTVRDAMTAKVEVATPSMPMSEAASLMLARQINMLPVVEGGKVVGVLTRHDVLRGIYASKSPFL